MSRRYLAFFLAIAGLAGVLYGLGANGEMSIVKPYLEATTGFDAARLSLLVGGCLFGSVCINVFAGALSDWLGRRKAFLAGALFFAAGSPLAALSGGCFGAIYSGVLMQGCGMGLVAVVMPMFIAETLPKEIRGRGTAFFQLVMIGGILVSGLIGLALAVFVGPADSPALSIAAKERCWQAVFWIVGGLSMLSFVAGLFLKESPAWLARTKGGGRESDTDRKTEVGADANRHPLFSRRYMAPFAIAFTILVCNQATGINAVLGYTTTIFREAGLSLHDINIADVVLKIAMFAMTAVACALVDRKGRVFLLELGTRGIVGSMVAAGLLMMALEKGLVAASPLTGWLALAALVVFISSFCIGPGVCVWLALTELMPGRIRAVGIGVSLMANQGLATGLQSTLLPLTDRIGYGWLFICFAACTVVYYLTVHLFMPETKGKTLEEIELWFAEGKGKGRYR